MRNLIITIKSVSTKLISLIFLILAIAVLVLSAIPFGKKVMTYTTFDKLTTGYVSDYYTKDGEPVNDLKPQKEYPIITYQVGDVKYEHTGKTEIGSYPYSKGIQVNIRYNSYKPEMAGYDLEMQENYISFAISAASALALFILSVFFSHDRIKRKQYSEYEQYADTKVYNGADLVDKLSTKVKKPSNNTNKEEKSEKKKSNWESSSGFRNFEDVLKENIRNKSND